MRWENSDSRRSTSPKRKQTKRFPIPSRIVVGALAIAAIVLAFVLRPPQLAQNTPNAVPEAKPTYVSAAIVPIATSAPPSTAVAAATPSVPAPGSAGAATKTHEVVQGDTLSNLAKKYYGDASKFNRILDANRDILKNADSLQLGMKLKIPE